MATIFKRFTSKKAQAKGLKPATKWSIRYKDEHGKWQMATGYADKGQTRTLAAQLEKEALERRMGIVNEFQESQKEALSEHVAAFRRHLADSKQNSADHVARTVARIEAIIDGCGFTQIQDLSNHKSVDRIVAFLKQRQTAGMSAATRNHYQTAMKGFVRWAIAQRRMPDSPAARIEKVSTENDTPRERRALTPEQFAKLIKKTRKRPTLARLTGEQRAWLYTVAADTGLRASELASLCPVDFHLHDDPPYIRVRASVSKNRQETEQPLRPDLATALDVWLPARADERIWPGRWHRRASEMIQADLKAAGIEFETAEGVFDFHALRGLFVTGLVRAGVHPKIAQVLARHSTVELTMGAYTKLNGKEIADALKGLPALNLAPNMHQKPDSKRVKRSQRVPKRVKRETAETR